MKTSELVRAKMTDSIFKMCMILVAIMFIQAGAVHGQESSESDNGKSFWKKNAEDRKHAWQGKKNSDLTFDEDSGNGNGHEDGMPGKRVGHSDDMPGKRLGHRKNSSDQTDVSQSEGNNSRPRRFDNDNNPPGRRGGEGTNWENLPGRRGGPGTSPDRFRRRGFDNDNNPPGRRGGEGTNWENLPGRRGGPGMSPDRIGRRGFDNDNNPPGRIGGRGTNWENKPGPRGGPGMSPDRRGFKQGNCNSDGDSSTGNRRRFVRGQNFQPNGNEGAENSSTGLGRSERKGSNGLHTGNRKNGVGRGIKNYTGNNPGRGRGKSK